MPDCRSDIDKLRAFYFIFVVMILFTYTPTSANAGEPGVTWIPQESSCNGNVFTASEDGLGFIPASAEKGAVYGGVQRPFGFNTGTNSKFYLLHKNSINAFNPSDLELASTVCNAGSDLQLVFEIQSPFVGIYSILISGAHDARTNFQVLSTKKFIINAVVGEPVESNNYELNDGFAISFYLLESTRSLEPILAVTNSDPIGLSFEYSDNGNIPTGTLGIGAYIKDGIAVSVRGYIPLSFAYKYGATVQEITSMSRAYLNNDLLDGLVSTSCSSELGFNFLNDKSNPIDTVCQIGFTNSSWPDQSSTQVVSFGFKDDAPPSINGIKSSYSTKTGAIVIRGSISDSTILINKSVKINYLPTTATDGVPRSKYAKFKSDGSFTVTLDKLRKGKNKVVLYGSDKLGNIATKRITINY